MREGAFSYTAIAAARQRAAHQVIDDDPKILVDSVAVGLVERSGEKEIREAADKFREPVIAVLRASFVMRSRYAEECLEEATRSGVRQFVLLGAGLDSFAYRQPEWARALRIFEVDHPNTQRRKRKLLARAGVKLPGNLEFCPVDFERSALEQGLAKTSFDPGAPAFFSWLGVTQYLTVEAIDATLKFILTLPRGSEIVMAFVLPDHAVDAADAEETAIAAQRCVARGEPWITRVEPKVLEEHLLRLGFASVYHLTPEAASERYFAGRRDGLRVYSAEQLVRAAV